MERIAGTPVSFVNVRDRDRALKFYCGKLGLTIRSSDGFGDFIDMGGGALLRMTVFPEYSPVPHPVIGWIVDDMSAAATALQSRGIRFTIYEGMGQDEQGIWTSPDGKSKVAYFTDPDGNVLSLSQA